MAGYPGGGIGFAAVVGGSALFQYMFLAGGGGHVVARSMGGRDISKETNHEVVQMVRELAHKANIPCPAVYIIPTQQLNAFAAGMNPKNAVVAVTQVLSSTPIDSVFLLLTACVICANAA